MLFLPGRSEFGWWVKEASEDKLNNGLMVSE
jgi:hypothetical protein